MDSKLKKIIKNALEVRELRSKLISTLVSLENPSPEIAVLGTSTTNTQIEKLATEVVDIVKGITTTDKPLADMYLEIFNTVANG